MHDMLKKMKKKEGKLPEHEKKAKMDVLSHLRNMAQESMSGKLGGLKKVSVMSDSPEGLEHGLEKAHELVGEHSEHEMEESPEHEASESPEEEASEESDEEEADLSPEAIDAQIAHLVELKQRLTRKG